MQNVHIGDDGWWKTQNEPAMLAHSPERQQDPGLHQKKRGPGFEGGDYAPLLHSGEIPLGVLSPVLVPQTNRRAGVLPCKFRLGKLGLHLKEAIKKPKRDSLSRTRVIGQGVTGRH